MLGFHETMFLWEISMFPKTEKKEITEKGSTIFMLLQIFLTSDLIRRQLNSQMFPLQYHTSRSLGKAPPYMQGGKKVKKANHI